MRYFNIVHAALFSPTGTRAMEAWLSDPNADKAFIARHLRHVYNHSNTTALRISLCILVRHALKLQISEFF